MGCIHKTLQWVSRRKYKEFSYILLHPGEKNPDNVPKRNLPEIPRGLPALFLEKSLFICYSIMLLLTFPAEGTS